MDRVAERATEWGIEEEFSDALGRKRAANPETVSRLVATFSSAGARGARLIPPTVVVRRGFEPAIQIAAPAGAEIRWRIEDGRCSGTGIAPVLRLPEELPLGIYPLRIEVGSPQAPRQEEVTLVVAPARAYQGREQAPRRLWALAVQLYGVRSRRNWGHGDFSDLAALIELAAEAGAAAVGLNPLHALFDDRVAEASPYSPNSRLFLNPLYIDVEAIPDFPGLRAAGLQGQVDKLRGVELVDYAGVADAKHRALRMAYEAFREMASAQRRQEFETFRRERGSLLTRYACFEVLRRRLASPWWDWPAEWRDADDGALAKLRATDGDDVTFVEYVQWVADQQFTHCCQRVHELGLPIGLYLDIAVGVSPQGFDAWNERESVLHEFHVGAPPDALNTAGQNWGLSGINPIALEKRKFEPYRRMLQASMRNAGAIRLDHVLGLKRLYLIPSGMQATEGAYVQFPFEALLAVTAQESVQNKCIVIGEDLGTVPENFRERLADWGIWSYQVMMFERDKSGGFLPPESYRENALVTFTTHDLATFAGWAAHHDLDVKRQLRIDPGESANDRGQALAALKAALGRTDGKPDFSAVMEYLAAAPSRLLVVSLEDALGLKEQPNVPGTVDEHPNWRRRVPIFLEDFRLHPGLVAVAKALHSAGRSFRPLRW